MNVKEAASLMGSKGGKKTAQRGKKYYRAIQKLGVESRKSRRNEILKNFTVGEIANPITSASVADALEGLDKHNV